MNKAAESLKKYLEGYHIELDLAIMLGLPSAEIDRLLDRINEVKAMIEELEKEDR